MFPSYENESDDLPANQLTSFYMMGTLVVKGLINNPNHRLFANSNLMTPKKIQNILCLEIVRIRSFSGPYFSAFRLSTKRYGASLCIQFKCGKIRTRKTPNTATFHAVNILKTIFAPEDKELPKQ